MHPMVLLSDEAQVEYLVLVHLDIVLILQQDRCTVCAEHTIGSKNIWTHPMELLSDVGHVESCFGPLETVLVLMQVWCTVYATCTIGSEIILDAPDGTPR